MHHYSATLGPLPAGKQVVLQTNIKLIEYPIDGLVDDIVQALWPVVKSRYRRHYHRPQLCSLNQQTQMAQMERRFPHAEHQRTTLFQHDIRRPGQQAIRIAMDNALERLH